MSPPIYTPDGSVVSEVVLPDGSTASEVIGPDGTVVFEAGPDIPDSAIHQWKFDEGSGSTAADSIGSKDGSITGATWTSVADLVGDSGLSFDGSDDVVDAGSPLDTLLRTGSNDDFSLAITANPSSTSGYQGWIVISNSNGARTNFGIYNGSVEASARAENGSDTYRQSSDLTTSRARYVMIYRAGTDTVEIWKNGTQVDDSTRADGLGSGNNALYIGATGTGGLQTFDGVLDNPIVYDTDLSSSEIQGDYDAQPWS